MGMHLSAGAVRPLTDLDWLDEAIGGARVVAIGESAHCNAEMLDMRHRLAAHLIQRHGFTGYAAETGFGEARLVGEWVRGGAGDLGRVMADGLHTLMGVWTQTREHLSWLRAHNATAARPASFHGIDLGGLNVSVLPGLDAVLAYLAEADPEFAPDPAIRETARACAPSSVFGIPAALGAYAELPEERKNALTAGLAGLTDRLTGRRLGYVRRTGVEAYERALRVQGLTVAVDAVVRAMSAGDQLGTSLTREAAIADTVAWILRREERIVLLAHNGHVMRYPGALPGTPPLNPMGLHLADRLGEDYLAIGATSGGGRTLSSQFYAGTVFEDLPDPEPGTLDALLHASHDGPFAVDLRTLGPADRDAVRAANRQRAGTMHLEVDALAAYDLLVHLPQVGEATPDPAALAHTPREVREAFAGSASR